MSLNPVGHELPLAKRALHSGLLICCRLWDSESRWLALLEFRKGYFKFVVGQLHERVHISVFRDLARIEVGQLVGVWETTGLETHTF